MPRAKKETCDLCCDPIQKEQDSLKCEGDCGCIVHRYCAGVTRTYYDALRKSSSPFVCQFCSLKANNAVIQQLQMTIESLKTELAAVKNLSMSRAAEPAPPLPSSSYAAAAATATNSQNGRRSRPQRTHAQQRKPAKPSTATHTSAVRTSEPSAEAATDARSQGSSESRSRESRKVAVVPGKRAVWGTLPFVTPTTVKSTIHNVLSVPDNSITVKRKTKILRAKQCWWFIITGTEGTLMSLETNWNKMTFQTGWKLQHCFAPLQNDDPSDSASASTGEAGTANTNIEATNSAASTGTGDSAVPEGNTIIPATIDSPDDTSDTPTPPNGSD